MIKRYSPDAYSDAGGLLVETMSHDPDGEYIRVADLSQYVEALQVAISTMEGIAHRNINTVNGHDYALRMHRRIDQLRALLAAVTGGNNENSKAS